MTLTRILMPAALAAALLALPAAAPAAKVAKTCDRLTGKAVVATPQIKVVSRRVRQVPRRVRRGVSRGGFIGRQFYGCTLPAGKVRKFGATGTTYLYERGRRGRARRAGQYGSSTTTFSNPVGTFVFEHSEDGIFGGPGAGGYLTGLVRDVATGRKYVYWLNENGAPGDFSTAAPVHAILSEQGVVAAIFDETDLSRRSVRGFSATGSQTVFDSVPLGRANDLPPESLTLDGTTVSWTNTGERRSGQIAP